MASTYLHKNQGSPTNAYKFTYSVWLKRSKLGVSQRFYQGYESGNNRLYAMMTANDTIFCYGVTGGNVQINLETTRKFKDTSSWYNVVLKGDSTLGTSTDRFQVWVNGVRETSLTIASNINQNTAFGNLVAQSNNTLTISGQETHNELWDGSMSHIHFTDGYAYDASAFGETDATTGEWVGKTSPSVTYGNTGYFILKDGNGITDQSGEGNDFTLGGGTLTDLKDNPDNVFATFNPLHQGVPSRELIYSNGNTTIEASASDWQPSGSTLAVSPNTGKCYWEFSQFVSTQIFVGLMSSECNINLALPYQASDGLITYFYAGRLTNNGSETESYFTAISAQTDVVGVALDMTAGTYGQVQFYHNGSATGAAVSLSSSFANKFVMPFAMCNGTGRKVSINTGNGYFGTTAITTNSGNGYAGSEGASKFAYQPPSGFSALSTKGLNE